LFFVIFGKLVLGMQSDMAILFLRFRFSRRLFGKLDEGFLVLENSIKLRKTFVFVRLGT
jgi:hypothetical protein